MKNKIFLALVLLVALGFILKSGIDKESSTGYKSVSNEVTALQSQDFDKLMEDEGVFLLDVHTPEQKHISGTDEFIPYDKINENLDKLPQDKDAPILVYCRSGTMSKTASEELVGLGYTKVYDLVGGINAYRESHVEVSLTPEVVDLGTVIYKDGAEAEFVLTNNTSNDLKIKRVTGSCACTQPKIGKDILTPYESTIIKVKFEPSVHKDDSDVGDLVRLVFVDTDNENFEHLVGKITAKVVK
jgi:rhodanese-related sulfurtransferase